MGIQLPITTQLPSSTRGDRQVWTTLWRPQFPLHIFADHGRTRGDTCFFLGGRGTIRMNLYTQSMSRPRFLEGEVSTHLQAER